MCPTVRVRVPWLPHGMLQGPQGPSTQDGLDDDAALGQGADDEVVGGVQGRSSQPEATACARVWGVELEGGGYRAEEGGGGGMMMLDHVGDDPDT